VADGWEGASVPSAWQIWSRAYAHNLKRPIKFVETVGSLVPAIIRARKLSANPQTDRRKELTAKTRFNARISSNRVTDTLIMELAQVKLIRKALNDVTINDIVVAIVGGALRKYLQSKDELPADSLIAGAPVNVRSEHNSESSGNQVSLMRITMATDIADPVERLQAIRESAQQSKAFSNAMGSSVMMDISEILIPQVLGWGFRAVTMAASRTARPMPCHVVISNVPGPQMPLYLAGARVHMMMGLGPLLDLMGLFHAVLSSAGRITINFISCREMMPDPEFYKACLQDSYEELWTAAQKTDRRPETKIQTKAKTKSKARKAKTGA
jgi:WS/DGAT/MGAT family acyltransferase